MKEVALCAIILFLSSCAHQSGRYIKVRKRDTLRKIASFYQTTEAAIINANEGREFRVGEWFFIPEEKGLIQLLGDKPLYSTLSSSAEFLRSGKLLWPVPKTTKISSPFGRRWGKKHDGVDIPGKSGWNIIAAEDGVVVYSGNGIRGYGNLTVVAHRSGLKTVYAHAKRNLTKKGQKVYRGQVIALLGNTGRSTGPHLHFEVRQKNRALNPMSYIDQSRRFMIAYKKR